MLHSVQEFYPKKPGREEKNNIKISNKTFLPVKDSCKMGEVGDILDPVGPLCQPTLINK
jgi:hypothetical protein